VVRRRGRVQWGSSTVRTTPTPLPTDLWASTGLPPPPPPNEIMRRRPFHTNKTEHRLKGLQNTAVLASAPSPNLRIGMGARGAPWVPSCMRSSVQGAGTGVRQWDAYICGVHGRPPVCVCGRVSLSLATLTHPLLSSTKGGQTEALVMMHLGPAGQAVQMPMYQGLMASRRGGGVWI
jgi:hypothetical protein